MGIFDSIASEVAGALTQNGSNAGAASGGLMEIVSHVLGSSQQGGLAGIVEAFQRNGLGDVVSSWIGTGQNLPVSADQLRSVLGDTQIADLARRFGLPDDVLTHQLSQALPAVIDKMSPAGSLPDDGGLNELMGQLKDFGR